MANTIAGMFSSPEDIRNARLTEIQAAQERARMSQGGRISDLNAMVAGSGYSTGRMLGEQLGGMLGMTSAEEARAQKVQEIMRGVGTGYMNDPENLYEVARVLNDEGFTEEALSLVKEAKSLGGTSSTTFGTEKEIKDEKGNIYKVTSRRSGGGYETVYTPLTPNAPSTPVGQIEIVGAYGETSSERSGRDVGTTGGREDAKIWSKMRGAAVEKFSEARSAISTINSALDLANKVATGGKVQEIAREMERLTGTMPADKGELIYLLNENILKQLKPTFGAQFTAKEGEWLARIMPNENDSNAVLVRKLNRIKRFTQDKAAQQMSLLKSKSYDDYTDAMTADGSISWIDEDLTETPATTGVPTKRFNPATGKIEVITEGK